MLLTSTSSSSIEHNTKMVKTLFSILGIIFLNTSTCLHKENKCKVDISYTGLPSPITINYEITNSKIKVFEEFYNPDSHSIEYLNESVFKDINNSKLIEFLGRTKWDTIPSELITPTIDGYLLNVEIMHEDKNYQFNIDNTYHPTFDTLFTICNKLIPKKKVRRDYIIDYSK